MISMNTAHTSEDELNEAASFYSDLHKDFYGFRPRNDFSNWTVADYDAAAKQITDQIERRKETFEGREQLRAEGWIADEVLPDLMQSAIIAAESRDAALKASYGDDWRLYGEESMLEAPKLRKRWGVA
jgi:hypothetical protein